jgi:RNA polymerase sigma factor (sigma-70 family)
MSTMSPEEAASPSYDAITAEVARSLVENHQAFLGFLERRLGDRDLARDVLQEAFLRGFEKLGTLRDDEAATAWFYRMLRNAVVDVRRRRAATERALNAFEAELVGASEPPPATQEAVCACVARLATSLQPEYRDALQSVEVDGLPVKEYAARAGISAGNAGVRVFRAREALRRDVERSCGACATRGCVDCTCGSGAPPNEPSDLL